MKLNYLIGITFMLIVIDSQKTDYYEMDEKNCRVPESKQRDLTQDSNQDADSSIDQQGMDADDFGSNDESVSDKIIMNGDLDELEDKTLNDEVLSQSDENDMINLHESTDQYQQVEDPKINSSLQQTDINHQSNSSDSQDIGKEEQDQTKSSQVSDTVINELNDIYNNQSTKVVDENQVPAQNISTTKENISITKENISQEVQNDSNGLKDSILSVKPTNGDLTNSKPVVKPEVKHQKDDDLLSNQHPTNDYTIQIQQQGSNTIIQQTNITRPFEIYPSQCPSSDYFLYQGYCVLKSCIQDKLSRFNVDLASSYQGSFILPISYEFQVNNRDNFQYLLTLKYPDNKNDTILGDPDNCIDWRLYQTANSFEIDPTRLNVQSEGAVPSWPKANYEFDLDTAYFHLIFTQQDVYDHQCIKLVSGNNIRWQCFFEFAFVVNNITQLSYYFSIQVDIDKSISSQGGVPAVNFNKIVEVTGCPPGQSSCVVEVTVNSDILFCRDSTCKQTSPKPMTPLLVNQPFWLLHQLTDDSFKKDWGIRKPSIMYQSYGFQLILTPFEIKIISYSLGQSIYELKVPIVSEKVVITASGELYEINSARILQTDSSAVALNKTVVRRQIDAGEVSIQTLAPQTVVHQVVQNKTTTSAKTSKILTQSLILLSILQLIL